MINGHALWLAIRRYRCSKNDRKKQLFLDSLAFSSEITYWVTKETHSGSNMDVEVSVSAKLCHSSFTVSPKIDAKNRISYLSGFACCILPNCIVCLPSFRASPKNSVWCVRELPS